VRGEARWVTSWGLADVHTVAAALPDDRILFFTLEGVARDEVRPSPPLALAAMRASCTVRLRFHDLFVPETDCVQILPLAEWRASDRAATAQPVPAAFGITTECVRRLEARAPDTAGALGAELARCRAHGYRLADTPQSPLPEMVAARAWSLDLAARAARALVAATGGQAMLLGNPAQRLLREASFFSIQAQTEAGRAATLARLAAR
jgi:alkylation response protein AidB-like acyl-CoA dehydrogenase